VREVVPALQAQLPGLGGDDGPSAIDLSMAHNTILRWVHDYAPEFEHRWNRFRKARWAVTHHRILFRQVSQRTDWRPLPRKRRRACPFVAKEPGSGVGVFPSPVAG
jgi:hypothetical protein